MLVPFVQVVLHWLYWRMFLVYEVVTEVSGKVASPDWFFICDRLASAFAVFPFPWP